MREEHQGQIERLRLEHAEEVESAASRRQQQGPSEAALRAQLDLQAGHVEMLQEDVQVWEVVLSVCLG